MAKNPATGLTDKQEQFCREYLKDFNATAAYVRAGYAANGAEHHASRLVRNGKVQAYLQRLREMTEKRSVVTLERTVEEISRVAFSNITNALTFNSGSVTLRDSDELPEDVTAAIESVSMSQSESDNGSMSVKQTLKMHNKMTALGYLADFFGIRDDFNKARATLKRYGLALVPDGSELGWTVEKYDSGSDTSAA